MERLIDADVACKGCVRYGTDLSCENCVVNDAPTIDAVEVVRCKNCIRRYDTDECPMCFLIEGKYYEYTNENGFCDRGERKEGADNS